MQVALLSFITDWVVDPPTCDCEYIVVVTGGPGIICACMTEFARMDGLFEGQTCKRKKHTEVSMKQRYVHFETSAFHAKQVTSVSAKGLGRRFYMH